MRRSLWALVCTLVTAGLAVYATPGMGADPIKIGIVDTYTGPASSYSNDVLDGFRLVVDQTNAKGGVLGRQITFVTRDDKFKPDLGTTAAKELIMREKVDLLMGTINSAVSLNVSELAKKEKIPFLVTFGKSAKITGEKGHRYVVAMNENTEMIGRGAAVALAKLPYVKYWIAGDDYEYGHSVADALWNHLKKLKPDVQKVGESWWKVGEPDFTPYITSILSAKPDAVIVATGGAGCVPFLKAAKTTGFHEQVPFFMHTAIEMSTLKPLGADAPAGVLGTSNYFFYFPETPENKQFVEEFKKAYNRYPSAGALMGYLTGRFIVKAYEKAGAVDSEKFIDAIAGLSMDSPVGKVTVRKADQQIMLPIFMGKTKKLPEYEFFTAGDIVTIPAEELMPSEDEILKMREK
jgi:branched-chain amino acid transport system substrate-binding protein